MNRPLGSAVLGLQVQAPGHRLEHDPLLGHRQRRAQTAPDAAAEGDPLVGPGLVPQPALGPEGEWLRVEIVAVVQQQDAHGDRGIRGHGVGTQPPGNGHATADHGDHGARAHALGDHRLDVLAGFCVGADRVAQALVGGGRPDKALPRPRERVRRRLVPREHEREQLVA